MINLARFRSMYVRVFQEIRVYTDLQILEM
jgi:hypothetical protein